MLKLLKSAFLAGVMSLAGIAVANASSGAWTNQVNEPLVYQTNWLYGPSTVTALSGTPSTGIVSTVSYVFGYYASTYGADPPYVLQAKICGGTACGWVLPNNKVGTTVSNDNYWATKGVAATASWQFSVQAASSTTKVFVSHLNPSRQFSISVNYNY